MNQQRQMVSRWGSCSARRCCTSCAASSARNQRFRSYGGSTTISCPGRERTNQGRAGYEGTYKDGHPVDIRLGLLRLGDVMIGGVNAEVFNPIAQRLKRESPLQGTR